MSDKLPPGFAWVEYVRSNDDFWDGLRSVLVNFVALDLKGEPVQLGSGFVIAQLQGGYLVVLTAKHVVVQGNIQARKKGIRRSPNAPSILFPPEVPDIAPNSMICIWMGAESADVLTIKYVNYPENLDLAVCIVQFQNQKRSSLMSVPRVGIDLCLPSVGDEVHLVALTGLESERTSNASAGPESFRVVSRPVLRCGTVNSIEPKSMGHAAPAFTTTIPVSGGMSGGFVYRPVDKGTIGACGIVSVGALGDEDNIRFDQPGNSTILGMMGTLGLSLPVALDDNAERQPILDFVHSGHIEEISGKSRWLRWKKDCDGETVEIYQQSTSLEADSEGSES